MGAVVPKLAKHGLYVKAANGLSGGKRRDEGL